LRGWSHVKQTIEVLRGRVGRHLAGRRSDAVAKFILDPFGVLELEVWPTFEDLSKLSRRNLANQMESAVFQKCPAESQFGAVLNEGGIAPAGPVASRRPSADGSFQTISTPNASTRTSESRVAQQELQILVV
jgi:hypothetical protein